MTEKTKKNIHITYSIVLSVLLAVAGICLMAACVDIYRSGNRPFTPASVAAAFSGIALPVYVCLGWLLGGFVLDAALPLPDKKRTAIRQDAALLKKLHQKLADTACEPTLATAIRKEQHKRKLHRITAAVLLLGGSFVFLLYGTNPANFHASEITASIKKAVCILLPCMAVPFVYSVFAAFYSRSSIKKEAALVKQALTAAPATGKAAEPPVSRSHLPWLRYGLLVIAFVLLLYGYFAGGTNDVLTKAINICTECVGLG